MFLSENIKNNIIFGLLGFSATGFQIIFLREFFNAFNGNEISIGIVLSAWLFWTAMGSFTMGKIIVFINKPLNLIILFQILIAIIAPATLVIIQLVSSYLKTAPGEILGFLYMIITSYALLFFFGLISGGLFSLGVSLIIAKKQKSFAVSKVYLIESIGSALVGVLLSLVLINYLNNLYICFIISITNLIFVLILTSFLHQKLIEFFIFTIISTLIIGIIFSAETIRLKIRNYVWKDFQVVAEAQSHFGVYNLISTGTSKTIYLNSTVLFTIPDKANAEEIVHFAMLEHPQPKDILLIGGGLNGSINEILKHPLVEKVDYVETDAKLIQFFENHFFDQWCELNDNSKINIYKIDARIFLRKNVKKYDVIILNQPDPQTAQLNRYYTEEFFNLVVKWLNPSGIFTLQTHGSENYINDELAAYLKCIYNTLNTAFKDVIIFPGDIVHFFAVQDSGLVSTDYQILVQRMKERNVKTQYIREYYLPFRLSPDRIDYINHIIKSQPENRINRDFHPTAYYFNMILWSTQFSHHFTTLVQWIETVNWKIIVSIILIILFIFTPLFYKSNLQYQITGALSVFCLGFTSLSAEILILLIFQIMYGYVYQQLAILIAAFMAGLSLGTYLSLKYRPSKRKLAIKHLLIIHLIVALFIGLLPLSFYNLIKFITPLLQEISLPIIFILITFIVGGIGGFQFPVAGFIYYSQVKKQNAGILYSLDLLGAMLGALLLSSFIIPLFGIYSTGYLIAGMNILIVLLLLFVLIKRKY
jgi:spermidine synthase